SNCSTFGVSVINWIMKTGVENNNSIIVRTTLDSFHLFMKVSPFKRYIIKPMIGAMIGRIIIRIIKKLAPNCHNTVEYKSELIIRMGTDKSNKKPIMYKLVVANFFLKVFLIIK